ncbi:hypothetical protein [Bradyrhizobium sp. S69]|uniref:hypothetical protein n=1 Tax=Bradyrhizobium sp. S69 TaxID=1641856 RepID=UPI001AEDA05F|nr:hypothetical protein [Bradyrhizobium sp. S69]
MAENRMAEIRMAEIRAATERQSVFEPTGRAKARPMTGSVGTGSCQENASEQESGIQF